MPASLILEVRLSRPASVYTRWRDLRKPAARSKKNLQGLRVMQPMFFLHGDGGKMFYEGAREEADSVMRLHSLSVEERNPLDAATW